MAYRQLDLAAHLVGVGLLGGSVLLLPPDPQPIHPLLELLRALLAQRVQLLALPPHLRAGAAGAGARLAGSAARAVAQ